MIQHRRLFHGLDPSLQEAAIRRHAVARLRRDRAPGHMRGIASGLMIVFVLSFNEFTLTYFPSSVDVFPPSIWLLQQCH